MDVTEQDPGLEPFDALIGTWDTEATHPEVDTVVPGSTTFEWLAGGHLLVQRSRNDHELYPGCRQLRNEAKRARRGCASSRPKEALPPVAPS
jgi:hypothetical protein